MSGDSRLSRSSDTSTISSDNPQRHVNTRNPQRYDKGRVSGSLLSDEEWLPFEAQNKEFAHKQIVRQAQERLENQRNKVWWQQYQLEEQSSEVASSTTRPNMPLNRVSDSTRQEAGPSRQPFYSRQGGGSEIPRDTQEIIPQQMHEELMALNFKEESDKVHKFIKGGLSKYHTKEITELEEKDSKFKGIINFTKNYAVLFKYKMNMSYYSTSNDSKIKDAYQALNNIRNYYALGNYSEKIAEYCNNIGFIK